MKYFHPKKWYRIFETFITDLFLNYILSDKMYLKYRYKKVFGKKLNLKNPQTFNEKIQWLKLYDRNPAYHNMVDKYEAKKFVADIIGEEYIIPTLGVWDSFDEIDFDKLPEQFVLKCNHDSASVVICKDKKRFDFNQAKVKLTKALRQNYYRFENRQWVYKSIIPKIIAEEYLKDDNNPELNDYKFFCFNGQVKYIQVDFDRFTNHKRNIYDTNWNFQNFEIQYQSDKNHLIPKPKKLDEMISIATKLSADIPHVRVDLYFIENKIYFGELTFYHGGGTEKFYPKSWEYTFGSWINLHDIFK